MIELKSGSFTMLKNDEPICEFNNVNGFIESEIEPYSFVQEVIKFNHEATFEAEITDYSPLMAYTTDLSGRPLSIEYRVPILVQARWHKKARIRKKWLKRYGYKEDVVKTIAKARYCEYNTETGGCEIDVDSIQFNFKQQPSCSKIF